MRAFFLLALLCSSCLSARHDAEPMAETVATSQPAEAQKASKKPKVDFEGLEFAVASAERRVRAGEMAGMIQGREAEKKVQDAELEAAKAISALEHLEEYTIPRRLAQEELSLDRSRGRLSDAEAELQQMRDMYKDEEFATSTKELVITRSERNVDQQKRGLELADAAREDLEAFELARDREDAVRKVEDAMSKVEVAKMRLDETMTGLETKALDAAEAVRKAKRSLAEARAKAEASA